MARRSYALGLSVGLIGLGACGGVVTKSGPDGSKDDTRSVEMSAGASAVHVGSAGASGGLSRSANGADHGGSSAAGDGAVGSAGSSLISGGASSSDGGSSSSGGSNVPSSAGDAGDAGDAGEPDAPQLSDCMPSDMRECSYCSGGSEGSPKVITGDVSLKTQSQVEALRGVVEITGNLKLEGDISLRSVHALCCLEKVDGSLVIQWMYNLGNVDGLSSLTHIGGDLSVTHSNCSNVNLKGLGSVKSVGGDFEVEKDECYLLTRIGPQNIAGHITRTSSEVCQ